MFVGADWVVSRLMVGQAFAILDRDTNGDATLEEIPIS